MGWEFRQETASTDFERSAFNKAGHAPRTLIRYVRRGMERSMVAEPTVFSTLARCCVQRFWLELAHSVNP
jgi:hypothetical protein